MKSVDRCAVALAALALCCSRVEAGSQIRLVAVARPEPTVTVELTATNDGDEAAGVLRPEVNFDHRTSTAPTLPRLGPGEHHTWTIPLAPPPGTGSYPIAIRLDFQRVDATPDAAVTVTTVTTPDAPPSGVRVEMAIPPLSHVSNVRLTLDNAQAETVGGRLAVVIPAPLFIEPESQAVQVEGQGRKEVPLVIERRGAAAQTFPLFAIFEFTRDGVHHTVLATGRLEATGEAGAPRRPVWIGVGALVTALAALAFALWRSSPARRQR